MQLRASQLFGDQQALTPAVRDYSRINGLVGFSYGRLAK